MIRILVSLLTIITACWVAYSASCIGISRTILRYRPDIDSLRSAQQLTPSDPLLQEYLAQFYLYSPDNNNPQAAYQLCRQATQQSPKDFRAWLLRAKISEQLAKYQEAEQAFEQAAQLAPNYFQSNWELANFRVRNDELPKAAQAFQRALTISPDQIPEALELIWQLTNGDSSSLKLILPNNSNAQIALINFLANKGELNQSVDLYPSLPIADDQVQQLGKELIKRLFEAKKFTLAGQIWSRLTNKQIESFDFTDLSTHSDSGFGWYYREYPAVKISPVSSSNGSAGLKIEYQAVDRPSFDHLQKILLVKPGSNYRLSFQLSTKELTTPSPPTIEIIDPYDSNRLLSINLPKGTINSQVLTGNFKVGATTEAVMLVINRRVSCPDSEPCPIFGSLIISDIRLSDDSQGSKIEAINK